jgi:hypothetical protein
MLAQQSADEADGYEPVRFGPTAVDARQLGNAIAWPITPGFAAPSESG